jgi:hypothetical protein
VTIRPNIELRADFPDDGIEDEHDFVQWPGRNITEALRDALQALGYQVSDPIAANEHGWELDVQRGRKRMWMQVTSAGENGECIIMTEHRASWFRPNADVYRVFLTDLQQVLEADPRFSQMAWLKKEYWRDDHRPAAGPFED